MNTQTIRKGQQLEYSHQRRSPRIRLQVPVFLRAADPSGIEFIELTKTLNISSFGACITSAHMLRENQVSSPRLAWLLENVLSKTRERILPQIRAAQADGALIKADPNLLYYMLIGMTSVLSSLKGEMSETIGFSLDNSRAVNRYWKLIEQAVFT